MSAHETREALTRLAAPLRGRSRAAEASIALGVAALVLGGAAWLARLGWFDAPYWVLVAWVAALAVLVALGIRARRAVAGLGVPRLARRLEEAGAWRTGALTSLLDRAAPGTSESLHAAADRAQAGDVTARGPAAVAPIAGEVRRRVLAGALCLGLGAVTLGSAGPVRGPAAALWHPARAWEATVAPVRLRASAESVDRGDSVRFFLQATGRREASLWLRAPGEPWRARAVELDSLGRAELAIGPLESDLYARLTSGSRSSDTLQVKVRLPAFLGALTVTAHYPRYLRLEAEPVPTTGDTIVLPTGTRLSTRGEATAELREVAWILGDSGSAGAAGAAAARRERLATKGRGFDGAFTPGSSGTYRLELLTAGGEPLGGDTVRLPIRLLADSAPVVEVPVPGADTTAPLDLLLPLVLDVRDDHGVTSVVVESRRISRLGIRDSVRTEIVTLPAGQPDRAILPFRLDLTRRGLLPGDTVRYQARAVDNSPRRQSGRSREFVLRLPTLSEVRAAQRQATDAVAGQLDSLAERSRRAERQTEDLSREQPSRGNTGRSRDAEQALSFDQAKRAEAAARDQQELMQQAEQLQETLKQLEQATEAAGLRDSAFLKRLEEIRRELDRALSPELRERLAKLQASLKDLDAQQSKDALERLAEAQRQMREAIERSRELFRRAAIEGQMTNLAQESRDLAREQRQWNDQVQSTDSASAAARERELAARADSLAAGLKELAEQAAAEGKQESLGKMAEQAKQAGGQMQQAGQSAQQGQRQQARRQGEQAAKSMQPIGDQLQQERQQMQQQWRQEVTAAIDRALSETSRLAERQLAIQESFRRGASPSQPRQEQAAVEEGVQKLLDQMKSASGKNALVNPQIGVALSAAQQAMQRAREAVSTASPNMREANERAGDAVDALNAAAYQLLRARGDVSGAGSGSGLAEAMERMSQLAQQQGGLGQQSAGLLPMAGSSGMQQQLRQLAARQRALANELERLRAQGNSPGAGDMANEAKDLARRLEAGRLDRPTVERQERLFRRMLDAGRTLQGKEEDEKERQSRTGSDTLVRLPPALQAKLRDENDRLRMPTWEELQQLSPEERRLVVDYFRRLSTPATR